MNDQEKKAYLEKYKRAKETGVPFFPDVVFKDAVVSLLVFVVLVALAFFVGAPLEDRANPSDTTYTPRPEWYFLAAFHTLKILPSHVLGVEGERLGVLAFGFAAWSARQFLAGGGKVVSVSEQERRAWARALPNLAKEWAADAEKTGLPGNAYLKAMMDGLRAGDFSRLIVACYLSLSVLCALAYWAAGMSLFDAVAHAMTTLSTGGYSTSDGSIGNWPQLGVQWTSVLFMLAGALPFLLYVQALRGRPMELWRDPQVRWLLALLGAIVLYMAGRLWLGNGEEPLQALTLAAVNVVLPWSM